MTKFILVDTKDVLVKAWEKEFKLYSNFEVYKGDIFNFTGDAIVSPANSFGFMDGGIDLLYSLKMGWHIQYELQNKIKNEFNGELLVGQATTISTKYPLFPTLISAPTMRVPSLLSNTPNIFLAAKAIFILAKQNPQLRTIVCPGLGTGTGGVYPFECANKMRIAYEDFYLGKTIFPDTLLKANIKNYEEITT